MLIRRDYVLAPCGPRRIVGLAALLLGLLTVRAAGDQAVPHVAAPKTGGGSDNIIEQFNVEKDGDLLLIPVTVHGRDCKFIVDTGCSRTVIDDDFRRELHKTGETVSINGTLKAPLYDCDAGFVGTTHMDLPRRVSVLDLSELRRGSGHDFRGALGMDFLRRFVVQIDFDAGRVTFLKSSDGIPGKRIQMAYDATGCPKITGRAASREVSFLVDTGACARVHLSQATFDSLVRSGEIEEVGDAEGITMVGREKERVGMLSSLSIGGFNHPQKSATTGALDDNSIGLEYLSRFHVLFDFPRGLLILAEGKRCYDFEPDNDCGLQLEARDADIFVATVREGGTAHQAGLRAGDRLLAVGRRSVRGMTAFAATRCIDQIHFPDWAQLTVQTPGEPPRQVQLRMLPPRQGEVDGTREESAK